MLTRLSNQFEKDALPEAKLNVVFGVIIRLLFVALLSLSLIGRTVGSVLDSCVRRGARYARCRRRLHSETVHARNGDAGANGNLEPLVVATLAPDDRSHSLGSCRSIHTLREQMQAR